MKECKVCGCKFEPNSNRQKYCPECKKVVLKKQQRKALIKYYKKISE